MPRARVSTGGVILAAIAVVVIVLVATSLRRPEPPTYPPTLSQPSEVGEALVGPVTYTLDSSDPEAWRFFDFSRGSLVDKPGPLDWDLAFRRFTVVVNGGEGFAGKGGVVDLGAVDFDSVTRLPADGYQLSTRDSVNAVVERWYDYGFTSHLLTPKPLVYGLRTADGRYAKLEMLSYYCPGAQPGCVTFRYVYQGAGGPDLVSAAAPPRSDSVP